MKKTKQSIRIAIAKDAIKQLNTEKFIATNMTYLQIVDKEFKKRIKQNDRYEIGAKECLLESNPKCKVCAKGAIFLSTIRKENKLKLGSLYNSNEMEENAAEIFGQNNLNRMEAVFENWPYKQKYTDVTLYASVGDSTDKKEQRISNFHNKYQDPKDLLIAILKNVVRNKGTFKL